MSPRMVIAIVLALGVAMAEEQPNTSGIPLELRPRYTPSEVGRLGIGSELRFHWRSQGQSRYFGPTIFREAGLTVREVVMSSEEHKAIRAKVLPSDPEVSSLPGMREALPWRRYLLNTLTSPREVLYVKIEPLPAQEAANHIVELRPVLLPEEIEFEKSGWQAWMPSLPEGYTQGFKRSGEVAIWQPVWRVDCGRQVRRQSFFDREQMDEAVYWFERPLSFDEGLRNLLATFPRWGPVREYGHHLLRSNTGTRVDQNRPYYGWQSGSYLIHLQLPSPVAKEMMAKYLEKYPPTWDAEFSWDPMQQTLRWLDEALALLRQGLDDPPNHLRLTFTWYAFDQGVFRVDQIVPGDSGLMSAYNQGVRDTHERWATRLDEVEPILSDYVTQIRSLREKFIADVVAARERITKHGVVYNGPERWRSYGDDPK